MVHNTHRRKQKLLWQYAMQSERNKPQDFNLNLKSLSNPLVVADSSYGYNVINSIRSLGFGRSLFLSVVQLDWGTGPGSVSLSALAGVFLELLPLDPPEFLLLSRPARD